MGVIARYPVLIALTLRFAVSPVLGGAKHEKGTPPPRYQAVITTVTPAGITITENNATRTFAVRRFTEVTIDGKRATAAELRPGMMVSVTLADPLSLSRITAVTNK
jgi:hypothetical protein